MASKAATSKGKSTRVAQASQASWPLVRFGDVVRDVKATVDRDTTELTRFVAGEHMDSEDIHLRRWGELNGDYLGPAFHRGFRKGQVLYGSRRTYLKKVAVAPFDGICANTTFVLESKDPEILLPELLPFIMLTDAFTEHSIRESKGSVNPYVNWKDIAKYQFPLPPKDEQLRIADILSGADESVQIWKDVFSQTDEIRRLLLHRCMRGQQSPGPRSSTSIGNLPRSWKVLSIGEAGEVQLGRQRSPAFQTGKYTRPYLRVANVFDGFLKLEDVLEMDFDERDYATFALKPGDILLNEGQSRELVGRCAVYNGEIDGCCFQNTLIRFRAKPGLHPKYAFYFLQHLFYSGSFAAIARQTTSIAHLGAERFCKLEMAIPPGDEQDRLVNILETVRQAATNANDHVHATENLKRAVSGQILSGTRCNNVIH